MIANQARINSLEKEEWLYTAKENFTPQSDLKIQYKIGPSKVNETIKSLYEQYFSEGHYADSLTKHSMIALSSTSIYDFTNLSHVEFNLKSFAQENKQG
ncbi:hypothetical protein N9N67_12040, partial [Bacteriovoracaceae bacterium]|nr:hypothetical protein [Bacteriovoracaceae bacterium]